jgi:hypothetical protein
MKYSVIGLLSMLLVVAVAATCAGDTVGVYADNGGMNCNIVDNYVGLLTVYVVHVTDGATASMFLARRPECWTGAVWVGDSTPYCPGVGCGDSQTGIGLVYGACQVGAIHVLTITYFVQAASQACCLYPLLPHPGSPGGQVEVTDCGFNPGVAMGLVATVNGGPTCPCGYPVPVEETTWGRVKALYTE